MKSLHCLLALVVVAPQIMAGDTGLYDLLDESHPKPLLDAVGRVTISSQSNDNRRYYLALQAASAFSLPCAQIGLVIGDNTIRFNSQGRDKEGRYTSIETQIERPELIPQIAQHFNAKVTNRRHPGHRMLVTFLPAKEEFRPGEPVIVKLRITNIGDAAFAYIQGGRQRGPRDN